MKKELPDSDYLNECLQYNADTGDLYWKFRPIHHFKNESRFKAWNKANAYKKTGTTTCKTKRDNEVIVTGIFLNINGVRYFAHRIIWKMFYGECPGLLEVDHKNRNPIDNRICNLRLATREQNERNKLFRVRKKSLPKGVTFSEKEKKYFAFIKLNGKSKNLGAFKTSDDARIAYESVAQIAYGEFHASDR